MMEQAYNLQQAGCEITNHRRTYNSSQQDYTIKINFTCFTRNLSGRIITEDIRYKNIEITKEQFSREKSDQAISKIEEAVSDSCLGISNFWRGCITADVYDDIIKIIDSNSPSKYSVRVWDFDVQVVLQHYPATDNGFSDCHMIPATDLSIESLETKIIDCENGSVCSICLEEFSIDDQAATMPCLHLFHGNCIVEWLNTSHNCPICRFEMPTS